MRCQTTVVQLVTEYTLKSTTAALLLVLAHTAAVTLYWSLRSHTDT
jgi:hypothetical protein